MHHISIFNNWMWTSQGNDDLGPRECLQGEIHPILSKFNLLSPQWEMVGRVWPRSGKITKKTRYLLIVFCHRAGNYSFALTNLAPNMQRDCLKMDATCILFRAFSWSQTILNVPPNRKIFPGQKKRGWIPWLATPELSIVCNVVKRGLRQSKEGKKKGIADRT